MHKADSLTGWIINTTNNGTERFYFRWVIVKFEHKKREANKQASLRDVVNSYMREKSKPGDWFLQQQIRVFLFFI